jgi:CheY-like chemotaxis protein
MSPEGRTYRLTEAGLAVSSTDDLSVPADYRRILALVTADTHFDVIRSALRRYSDKLIVEWVEELKEIGYLEMVPDESDFDLDFTKPSAKPEPQLPVEDVNRISDQAKSAKVTLARAGAWIAEDRLQNRPAASVPPADTTVLIVEDDPDQLALADLRVAMAGYRVRVARDARELLGDLRGQPLPAILLLDVMLPDGNGFDILAKLRKHPKFALLPVAMLTAKDDPQEITKGLGLGADGYITKPYSKNILAETIGRILKTK